MAPCSRPSHNNHHDSHPPYSNLACVLTDLQLPPAMAVELGMGSLLAELPQVDNELVPLSHLVERVTAQAYNELAGLAET